MSARARCAGTLLLALAATVLAQKVPGALDARGLPVKMAFFDAIQNGRISEVDALLKQGFSVNDSQDYGFNEGDSPLMKAAEDGNAQMVDFLLRRGAQANYRNPSDMQTALFRAVKMTDSDRTTNRYAVDYAQTLKLLLQAGASPDLPDHSGQLPLYVARRAVTIQALLEGGANPNARTDRPPLLEHATDAESLTLLLRAGADPDVRDVQGHSALHIVAGQGNLAAVRAVLAAMRPETIRASDENGRTALHAAAWGGNPEVVGLLLALGLPPGVDTLQASIERGHLHAARLQREALGDVPWPAAGSQAPIDLRVYTLILQAQPAQALAAYQAFEREACGRKTPLMKAVDARNIEAVRTLLALGVEVNYQTPAPLRTRQLPPHPMSSSGHPRTVYELPPPCEGAVATAGFSGGGSALLAAVQRDDIAIARLLLAAGADPTQKSHYPPNASVQGWWARPGGGMPPPEWKRLLKIE